MLLPLATPVPRFDLTHSFDTWAQAGFLLGQVLGEHPGMKPIVVRETEAFIFRPGLQERARYYAIVFLNQLILSRNPAHGKQALSCLPICHVLARATSRPMTPAIFMR